MKKLIGIMKVMFGIETDVEKAESPADYRGRILRQAAALKKVSVRKLGERLGVAGPRSNKGKSETLRFVCRNGFKYELAGPNRSFAIIRSRS